MDPEKQGCQANYQYITVNGVNTQVMGTHCLHAWPDKDSLFQTESRCCWCGQSFYKSHGSNRPKVDLHIHAE